MKISFSLLSPNLRPFKSLKRLQTYERADRGGEWFARQSVIFTPYAPVRTRTELSVIHYTPVLRSSLALSNTISCLLECLFSQVFVEWMRFLDFQFGGVYFHHRHHHRSRFKSMQTLTDESRIRRVISTCTTRCNSDANFSVSLE